MWRGHATVPGTDPGVQRVLPLPHNSSSPVPRPVPCRWHVAAKWQGCVKYPATHMAISAACPRFAFVAGLDYECAAGRWDGSSGGSAGNANSGSGGHGRAVGPAQLQQQLGDGGVTLALPPSVAPAAAAAAGDEEAAPRAGARGVPCAVLWVWAWWRVFK